MKKLKNTLTVSSYVLLVALFFAAGYAIGKTGEVEEVPVSAPIQTPAADFFAGEAEVRSPVYEVIIEDGVLKINKCIGEDKTTIVSEEISEDVFPRSDIEELGRGVEFSRLEEAQQMFENFVS